MNSTGNILFRRKGIFFKSRYLESWMHFVLHVCVLLLKKYSFMLLSLLDSNNIMLIVSSSLTSIHCPQTKHLNNHLKVFIQ